MGSGLLEGRQDSPAEGPTWKKHLLNSFRRSEFCKWKGSQGWAQLLLWLGRNAKFCSYSEFWEKDLKIPAFNTLLGILSCSLLIFLT